MSYITEDMIKKAENNVHRRMADAAEGALRGQERRAAARAHLNRAIELNPLLIVPMVVAPAVAIAAVATAVLLGVTL